MDNFDLRKYLVENKATTNSKMMSEETSGPSEQMHKLLLTYIKPEFHDKYPKDYGKYFDTIQAGGAVKKDKRRWLDFLNKLVNSKITDKEQILDVAKIMGAEGLEGLADRLTKIPLGSQILKRFDHPSSPVQEESKTPVVYTADTFRKPSEYKEEVEQIKNLIKKTYPEYVNSDISSILDADMELVSIAYKVYGINVSVDDIYTIINNEDPSELPQELQQAQKAIEGLTGEAMLALKQAMKDLNIEA